MKNMKLFVLACAMTFATAAAACSLPSVNSSISVDEGNSSVNSTVDPSNSENSADVDKVATAMTLTPSANTIRKGEQVTFTAVFTPEDATETDYTLSIEGKGADFAQIVDGVLTIKEDATPVQINGQEIRVKAVLNSNPAVFNYAFIEVSEEAAVTYLSCEKVNVLVNRDSNKSIITQAYNWDGEEMELSAADLTYEVADETIATVDATGKVTAKGHGSTVVTVKYGAVSAQCTVNVMVAPESIRFDNLNTHMTSVGSLYYGMGAGNYLDLGIVSETKTGYLASTQQLTYKFEDVDSGETANLATVTEEGISFLQTGKIRVTVVSNSAVDGYEVSEQYEVKKSIIVNVNEGINLYTLDDLKEYAKTENIGKTANVMTNLYVTDDNNFGDAYNKYIGLQIWGSRTIQGNGCIISAENLSPGNSQDTEDYAFIQFHHGENVNAPFSVELYDLTLLGNVNIKGEHLNGTDLTTESKKLKNNYYRALEFSGVELASYNAGMTKAILENVVVSNVTVKGFYTGMRFEHAISALVEDVTIGDCFANAMENVQSHMVVRDVEVEQVGAFGIEISSDDMKGANTASPAGTAGRQYDETATIRYEGYFKCNNLNNGASTVYMQKLAKYDLSGISVADLVKAATLGLIQKLSAGNTDIQNGLLAVCGQTMMTAQEELNFSTLVFVNPFDFQQYATKGNTEEKFCEFSTTEKINVKTMFENLIANPNYNYKEKKYLILDLADLDIGLGVPVNVGQIILMNLAYEG